MTTKHTLKRIIAGTLIAATAVVSTGLGTIGTAGAATADGASATCVSNRSPADVFRAAPLSSDIYVTLPTWLATGRTFVRYSVVPDVGPGFTTGFYWADNVGMPGYFGGLFNSASKYWTKSDGSMLRHLADFIGTAGSGTRHRIWQQRYVVQNGRVLGGTWEQVNYISC